MLYIREFNGRQLMSPICRLIDFCVRTFCSTGGWNCAAVSNDGLGFMRVVGREQSIVSRANSPAIVTFVRVFWAKYCEVRRGEGPLGSGHRAPAQQPGVCSGQWRAPSGGARQLRFLCVPWWWTSCLAAWPGLSQRELFHSLRWCRVQCLLLLSLVTLGSTLWTLRIKPSPHLSCIYCRV